MGVPVELQVWLSPSFPIGSFAYSHALEWAVGAGRVHDRATAAAWLADLIEHGGVRNDVLLLAEAWRTVLAGDMDRLVAVNEMALAMAGSRERLLETSAQGSAFLSTVRAAWGSPELEAIAAKLASGTAYPVAVGAAAGLRGLALDATLQTFVIGVIANLVSALVRMSAVGQTDGQRIIASLVPAVGRTVADGLQATLDDLGGAAFVSDVAACAHEVQDTRMFRS